ncbi:hypothetical protein CBR_g54175 [Chara braunii]|uniref:Uncharacterized protein n=1 Tax=Chara braunii TaxID=69332 RepID=A0A388K750_CHABU|nr:hypothetical protein CBR_g54175 [Chara braunii]|eukprot:GBG65884.1 hypothetical protein CBR_g54175 [Chara braunii]
MQDRGAIADDEADTPMHGHDISHAGDVGAAGGQPSTSRGISLSQSRSKGGHDSHAMQGTKAKKRTRETSPTASNHKRQARTDAVNEYDEQGFATQDVHTLHVDVMRIKRIPRGRILFNHRSLSGNIVRSIENAIESSISTDPGAWDRPELVLAPVDHNDIVGGQGRRITPAEFFKRDPADFDWYAVCGQHTVEVMKRLVRNDSPTVKVYGLQVYSKMFNEGKLPVGDGKIPLDMPGRMEGRLPGPYTDETKGQRTLYHCIYARDGPKGSTVSWKDLCPSHFKIFGDLTCRAREVASLLLMKGNVVATNVNVLPPRVNTECLLDIMRKERYMVRMFNYVLFRAEGGANDEWNDAFFMSYKDLEDMYGPNGLCAAEWEKERDKLHVNKAKMIPRRLGGVEEARQGAGLGPTAAMYKEAPFHLKVFIYTAIDKLDLLRAEVKRIASSARHIVWDNLGKQTTLLPVCMPSKEVLAVPDDIVQSDVLRHLFRWEDVEVIPETWKRVDRPPNDITRYGNMATTSRDMMAIVLHAEGGDLKKVTVKPRLLNDLKNVHVVEEKFRKCQGKHGGIEGDDSAVYSIWEREPGKLCSLCGSFVGEAEGVLLLGRAHACLVWEFLQADNNVIVCDDSAKDIAYLTKFVDILIKDERFACHVEKPRCKHRSNRDMFHKLGPKRLKVWEYLFRDAPQGRLDGNYIYRKAKVTETLKHYHGALTGAFETFVARCEILKFDLHKDQLTAKDYVELAKSGDGFNPVDSEEDTSESDLELGEDTGGEGSGGGMVRSHDEGTVRSHERPVPVTAHSVGSMVAPMEGTGLPNMRICGANDEDDIDMPGEASKLAPGDPIPPGYCADPTTIYFLGGKHARTGESGQSEGAVKAKAKELFYVLRDNRQLEYNWKFYALRTSPSCGSIDWKVNQTAGTMEESNSQDVVPLSASPPVPTQAGQREDDGTTVVKAQEVDMTSMPQISVATTEPSKRMDVSNRLSSDAGATYGSLLMTCAALEGRSEMESESGVGLSVPDSQLQPELCTGKGDAQSPLTPQGGAAADGGKGGDVEGILHPRNLETLTDDFDYEGEGGNDVVNTRGV